MKATTPERAMSVFLAMGLTPLVPFPGRVSDPWPSTCMTCQKSGISPNLNTVLKRLNAWSRDGGQRPNACNECAAESRTETNRWNGYTATVERASRFGWKLLTKYGDYKGQKNEVQIRCEFCNFETKKHGQGIRKPCRCNWEGTEYSTNWFKPIKGYHPLLFEMLDKQNNSDVNLDRLASSSPDPVWWLCPSQEGPLPHRFLRSPATVVRSQIACPYCRGLAAIPGISDLHTYLIDNGARDIIDEWDSNQPDQVNFATRQVEPISLTNVLPFSNSNANWICKEHGHTWSAPIQRRSLTFSGCPTCANRTIQAGQNDLASQSETLMKEWVWELNDSNPSEVYVLSPSLCWWRCSVDSAHIWEASPYNRLKRNSGCPHCADRGYNPGRGGVLYFLTNETLFAGKFGITNHGTSRIENFQKAGWTIYYTLSSSDGRVAQLAEKSVAHWFRHELKMPPYLDKREMPPHLSGHTETFGLQECPSFPEIVKSYKKAWSNALDRLTNLGLPR